MHENYASNLFSVKEPSHYGITFENGQSVAGIVICLQVLISTHGMVVTPKSVYLELGSTDVIHGMQWLTYLLNISFTAKDVVSIYTKK